MIPYAIKEAPLATRLSEQPSCGILQFIVFIMKKWNPGTGPSIALMK
jgi:hypothetical protein